MHYLCHFRYGTSSKCTVIDSVADAKEGFWIDKNQNFCKTTKSVIWIPPNAVLYVEKVTSLKNRKF